MEGGIRKKPQIRATLTAGQTLTERMGNSSKLNDNQDPSASDAGAGTADASSPAGPSPYSPGEIVLASHKGCFYEAKVEKVALNEKAMSWVFFIHYVGWKRHWDEWVGVDRIEPGTEENLQRKTVLDKKDNRVKDVKTGFISQSRAECLDGVSNKKQLCDTLTPSPSSIITIPKKKRKRIKVEVSTPLEKSATIFIPLALKKQLMDDFEFVSGGKLVKLPRSPNVDEILIKYNDYRKQEDGVISESVEEILSGLRSYFDKALPVLLLYNKERQQYEQAAADNISPSKLYGAEHLLRLFVKLPTLLHNLNIEEPTLTQLQQKLQELLKFLRKNHQRFFLSSYQSPEHSETPPETNGT